MDTLSSRLYERTDGVYVENRRRLHWIWRILLGRCSLDQLQGALSDLEASSVEVDDKVYLAEMCAKAELIETLIAEKGQEQEDQ